MEILQVRHQGNNFNNIQPRPFLPFHQERSLGTTMISNRKTVFGEEKKNVLLESFSKRSMSPNNVSNAQFSNDWGKNIEHSIVEALNIQEQPLNTVIAIDNQIQANGKTNVQPEARQEIPNAATHGFPSNTFSSLQTSVKRKRKRT